jgi:hypothetical protein
VIFLKAVLLFVSASHPHAEDAVEGQWECAHSFS